MLFNTRRRRRPNQNPNWLQKKRKTVNVKLRQAIIDVMPFTTDKEEADRILHAIFDCMVEGLIRDGKVTVPWLGRLELTWHIGRWKHLKQGRTWIPAHWHVVFIPAEKMRLIKELDGDTGTDQGT
jgi:nucleoid DNA-binding protein